MALLHRRHRLGASTTMMDTAAALEGRLVACHHHRALRPRTGAATERLVACLPRSGRIHHIAGVVLTDDLLSVAPSHASQ